MKYTHCHSTTVIRLDVGRGFTPAVIPPYILKY